MHETARRGLNTYCPNDSTTPDEVAQIETLTTTVLMTTAGVYQVADGDGPRAVAGAATVPSHGSARKACRSAKKGAAAGTCEAGGVSPKGDRCNARADQDSAQVWQDTGLVAVEGVVSCSALAKAFVAFDSVGHSFSPSNSAGAPCKGHFSA